MKVFVMSIALSISTFVCTLAVLLLTPSAISPADTVALESIIGKPGWTYLACIGGVSAVAAILIGLVDKVFIDYKVEAEVSRVSKEHAAALAEKDVASTAALANLAAESERKMAGHISYIANLKASLFGWRDAFLAQTIKDLPARINQHGYIETGPADKQ